MAPTNPNDPRPPYVQIADELRRAILAGELKPGERVESGRELAKQYDVAQMTVHSALNALKTEGLLVSWQGRGVFVANPLPEQDGGDVLGQVAELRAAVDELRQRVAALETGDRS